MAESTLNVAYNELQGEIGFYLGYGRGAVNGEEVDWDTNQRNAINRITRAGLNYFYHCGYEWSFLKPLATLTLASGTSIVPLPDDYGSADGAASISAASSIVVWDRIEFTGVARVYHQHDLYPTTSSRPVMLAEEPVKQQDSTKSQTRQLKVWPKADMDYILRFQYNICPDALNGTLPYAYGGPQYAEVRIAACYAAAELIIDGIPPQQGPRYASFQELMQNAQQMDYRNKPMSFGMNLDRSDFMAQMRTYPLQHGWSNITVGGILYGQ